VKLLFDQHLSPRLVENLSDLFPGSEHVFRVSLDRAVDTEVWDYARQLGFTIVTKDADYSELSEVRGFPPKVLWVKLGNYSTAQIASAIRQRYDAIIRFEGDANSGILILI